MKQAKGRKIGRSIKKCQVYKALGIRERNKAKRALRHLRKHPHDVVRV